MEMRKYTVCPDKSYPGHKERISADGHEIGTDGSLTLYAQGYRKPFYEIAYFASFAYFVIE